MSPERRLSLAKLVSEVLGPVPVGVVLAVAVGIHSGRGILAGVAWGLLSVTCAAVVPAVATTPLRRRHPRTRSIRLGYMSLAIAGAAVGLAVLELLPAPSDIRVLAAGFAVGLICSAAINVIYASSNHVAALSGGAVLAAWILTPWAVFAFAVVAMQAFTRVNLKKHTLTQVVTGAGLGATSAAITLWFLI